MLTGWPASSARRSKDTLSGFISVHQQLSTFIRIYPVKKLFITMMYTERRTPSVLLLLDKLTSAPTVPFFICSRQPARLLFVNHFIGKKAPLRSKNAYYWNDIV